MSGLVLRVNGTVEQLTREPTLEDLQRLVGGWIERVTVDYDGELADLIVNEEGLLNHLPVNEAATRLYRTRRNVDSLIVGDAVLLLAPWLLK